MDTKIIGLEQSVSFEDGSVTNFIALRLPQGQVIRAVITDESADLLVKLVHGVMEPAAKPVARQQAQASTQEDEGHVFGGDFVESLVEESEAVLPVPKAMSVEEQVKEYKKTQKENAKRGKKGPTVVRSVQKDEYGYPIATGPGVNPNDIVTQGGRSLNADEDGIGSI